MKYGMIVFTPETPDPEAKALLAPKYTYLVTNLEAMDTLNALAHEGWVVPSGGVLISDLLGGTGAIFIENPTIS